MPYFKIKDGDNIHVVEAKNALHAVELVKEKKRLKDKVVIGVHDGVEYSFYNGKFYAGKEQIKDDLIIDAAKEGE